MRIYVNEQELDASLSGEKTLDQVYEAVSRWSSDHKKYILNLKVDSREISIQRLADIPADGVDRVDFYIGDEMDMVLSTLTEMDRYVDQIGSTLVERTELERDDAENLREGTRWMSQIMGSVAAILSMSLDETYSPLYPKGDDNSRSIASILEGMKDMANGLEEGAGLDRIGDYLGELRAIKIYVTALRMQLGAMHAGREELLEIVEDFEEAIPELVVRIVGINESFGAGKDLAALESLDEVTEKLNGYIASLFALDHQLRQSGENGFSSLEIEGIPFSRRADSLMVLLRDLSSALEDNDIVATGDILEYELTEQLELIKTYLPEARRMASAAGSA